MGYRDSPRLFCKILKPVLAHLRKKGFISSIYIDDFYIQGSTYLECLENVKATLDVLIALGFEISEKSELVPSRSLQHLGFILNSSNMSISLSEKKRLHIKELISKALKVKLLTIKELASLIGTLVASFPGVQWGMLFYRELEFLKIASLQLNNNNYKGKVALNALCREELNWWLNEGLYCGNVISQGNPSLIVQTDSSSYGWGALIYNSENKTQGLWSEEERSLHINALEIKAASLGVKALCSSFKSCHIQVQIDNTTAVSYINAQGGTHSKVCNALTKDLLLWCKERNIHLSSCHIPGIDNEAADKLSRKMNDDLEWMLNPDIFQRVCDKFGKPEVDLFSSRINHQLPSYCSYHPDSKAFAVNAFSICWNMYCFIFAPFNLISRCLRKIQEDRTEKAVIIVPRWSVAPWHPKLQKMLLQPPFLLPNLQTTLILPQETSKVHPLFPKLRLTACLLSGKSSNRRE